MSTTAKPLRYPFKIAASAGEFVCNTVNSGVDTSIDYSKKAVSGVKSNKFVTMVTKTITAFENDVVSKSKPYTAKAKPYIQPVVPYIEKAKPYAPSLAIGIMILAAIPFFFAFFVLAMITSPVWGFFALITSFLWVPLAICAAVIFGGFFFAGAAVYAVRYFSKPTGRAMLLKHWKKISSTSMGQKMFYVQ